MAGGEQNQACSWLAWKLFLWLHQRPRLALKLKTENGLRLRDWYLSFYNRFLSCNGECSILHKIFLLHMTCGHCHFSHNSTLEVWTLPPLKHLDNMKDSCSQRRFFYWSTNAHTPSSLTSNTILCLLLETSNSIPVFFHFHYTENICIPLLLEEALGLPPKKPQGLSPSGFKWNQKEKGVHCIAQVVLHMLIKPKGVNVHLFGIKFLSHFVFTRGR